MTANPESGRARQLDDVLALVRSRIGSAHVPMLEAFVQRYFGQVDPEDLAERAARAISTAPRFRTGTSPTSASRGSARVRVFNPTVEEHGWQSTHTIVEIVNDDMPFLVDSVTMEVNRHGLTLHLIIHPLVTVQRDARRHADGPRRRGRRYARRESFIHVEVDRILDRAKREALAADVGPRARRRARGGRRLEEACANACRRSSPK